MTRKPATKRFLRSAKTGKYVKRGAKPATTVSEPRPIWTGYAFLRERGCPILYSSLEQTKYLAHLYSDPAKKVSLYLSRTRSRSKK